MRVCACVSVYLWTPTCVYVCESVSWGSPRDRQPGTLHTDAQSASPTNAYTPALECQNPAGAGAAASKSRPEKQPRGRAGSGWLCPEG